MAVSLSQPPKLYAIISRLTDHIHYNLHLHRCNMTRFNDFRKSAQNMSHLYTVRQKTFFRKFATKRPRKAHLKLVTTLPCEILMSENYRDLLMRASVCSVRQKRGVADSNCCDNMQVDNVQVTIVEIEDNIFFQNSPTLY